MAEPLKGFFSAALVKRIAASLRAADGSFPAEAFTKEASRGLEKLELVDRARHIGRAMGRHLPQPYPSAVHVILRSLGPAHAQDELEGVGMEPFFYMPHLIFVAEAGLDHFDVSMRAQYELTQRFTAEFSIRAFLERHPERTLSTLEQWALDPRAHVRRLVSEGTRLRLPWGARVKWLDTNPDRILALLDLLKDDPTTLVRRSVANAMNDMYKVHPERALQWCGTWLEGGVSDERRALVEHALRMAVKRGDPRALELVGYGDAPKVELAAVKLAPKRVKLGGDVLVSFEVVHVGKRSQDLLVDFAVHFVKSSGKPSPKVFKLGRVTLAPGERAAFSKRVSLKVHTTRKPFPGRHEVDVLVNGTRIPAGAFSVVE
ncbi:MAG: DNA alkylation repair protein [Polyangiaceae bacterium]|nr:DNA alkylation repair protein [Polyangiaceae bacterium]